MTTTEKAPDKNTTPRVARPERKTYRATIEGDRIKWQGAPPDQEGPWEAEVVVEETRQPMPRGLTAEEVAAETPEEREARGKRITAAFEALQAAGTFSEIEDPVAWQREIRKDKVLVGREG